MKLAYLIFAFVIFNSCTNDESTNRNDPAKLSDTVLNAKNDTSEIKKNMLVYFDSTNSKDVSHFEKINYKQIESEEAQKKMSSEIEMVKVADKIVDSLNKKYKSVPNIFRSYVDVNRTFADVYSILGKQELTTKGKEGTEDSRLTIWWYGNSKIYFLGSKVIRWENIDNNLRTISRWEFNLPLISKSKKYCIVTEYFNQCDIIESQH